MTLFKQLQVDVSLRAEDLEPLKYLLDTEFRRIHEQSPHAFDNPTSWASQIARLRDQITYIRDNNLSTSTITPTS